MALLALIGLGFLGYALYYVIALGHAHFVYTRRGIPWETFWPFLGNLGRTFLLKLSFFDTFHRHYGLFPTAKYSMFFHCSTPAVFLRDLDLIKSIGIRNIDSFTDHDAVADEAFEPIFALNVINLKGQRWRRVRALLSPAFTVHKIKHMYGTMFRHADIFAAYLREECAGGREVEMRDLFSRYSNDAIADSFFGVRVDSLADRDNEFYVRGRAATSFDGWLSLKFLLRGVAPKLTKFLGVRLFDDGLGRFFEDVVRNTIEVGGAKWYFFSNH